MKCCCEANSGQQWLKADVQLAALRYLCLYLASGLCTSRIKFVTPSKASSSPFLQSPCTVQLDLLLARAHKPLSHHHNSVWSDMCVVLDCKGLSLAKVKQTTVGKSSNHATMLCRLGRQASIASRKRGSCALPPDGQLLSGSQVWTMAVQAQIHSLVHRSKSEPIQCMWWTNQVQWPWLEQLHSGFDTPQQSTQRSAGAPQFC